MAKQFTETQQEKDELSRIFNDYRTRLDEITRQMQQNLGFSLPEPDPPPPARTEDIVIEVQTKAELEPEEMFAQIKEELEIKVEPDSVSETPETNMVLDLVSETPATNMVLDLVSETPETNIVLDLVSETPATNIEPTPVPKTPEPVVVKESEEIIREAKQKASRIIAEAEKRIKDEAKKKTESQVNKIISQAQKEAQDIIGKARQYTEEQKKEAINALRQQAQQSIDEIVEECRQDTYEQSSLIIRESQDKAAKMTGDILDTVKEMSQLLEEAVVSTGNTINDFEARIKTGNETLLKAISQSQTRFLQITTAANEEKIEENKTEPESQGKRKETKNAPALTIRLMNDNHDTQSDGLFRGKIEVKSVSTAFDYTYLKNLKKFLIRIPSIKYLQQSASEKAVTMMFEIRDPLPLPDILRNIPLIDEVISETDGNLWVTFKVSDHL